MEEKFNKLNNYIDKIISKNQDYIDIDILIELIEKLKLTNEEKKLIIKKIYSYNLRITQNIAKENAELEKIDTVDNTNIADIKLNIPKQNSILPKFIKKQYQVANVSNYVEIINQFVEPGDFVSLTEIINNDDFENTINYLLAYYNLELMTLRKLQYEEKTDVFNNDEEHIKKIISNLQYLQNSEQQDDLSTNNQLVYLTTKYGNIIFLNRINRISQEYYESIATAFNSIQNGNLKNNKRIGKTSDGFYSPLFQVRDNNIRIFYLKITANIYLIIDVMVKKFNTNRDYSNYIRKISKFGFIQAKEFLQLPISEQQLKIEQNTQITSNINSILGVKKKVLK